MIAALKETGDRGAHITIGDNANGVQIQQNSSGATQSMTNVQGFDYQKAHSVLTEIKEYADFPQFTTTFGSNTENVKAIIDNTIDAIEKKEDEGFIKKSLRVLKDLAVGAGSSLISTGILALLETLPL